MEGGVAGWMMVGGRRRVVGHAVPSEEVLQCVGREGDLRDSRGVKNCCVEFGGHLKSRRKYV